MGFSTQIVCDELISYGKGTKGSEPRVLCWAHGRNQVTPGQSGHSKPIRSLPGQSEHSEPIRSLQGQSEHSERIRSTPSTSFGYEHVCVCTTCFPRVFEV